MTKKLALIHTSATLVPVFQELAEKKFSGKDITVFNIVDDSLLRNTIENNGLNAGTSRRVVDYIGSAETAGADFILVTCSSIGPAVEAAVPFTAVPVLRVDQPMADKAVRMGKKIGILATLFTTLEPTRDLVRSRAEIAGKEIEITAKLCEGAFDALMNGNEEMHDQALADAIQDISGDVDVIVLAQASMARIVSQLPEEVKKVPILSSPEIAMEYLAENLW